MAEENIIAGNSHLLYLKTAVAIACIRSKPDGLPSREFAEKLCAQHLLDKDRWKQKFEEAEKTILRLKQTHELKTMLNFSDLADLLPFISFNTSSLVQSLEPMQVESSASQIKQNTDFIRSYLMLKQLKREIPHKLPSDNTVYYTLRNSLHMLKKSLYQDENVSVPTIRECFQVISQLSLDMSTTFPLPEIQELVGLVINRGLESKTIERNQRRELILSLQELLNFRLRQTTLESLLAAIERFSAHLRTVSQSETPLNTLMYENIYFLFEMLQLALKVYQDQGAESSRSCNAIQMKSGSSVVPVPKVLQEVTERLDKCVLYLSDNFPLFVCKIWLIKDNLLSSYKRI